ncbi:hypothetical protein SDC9_102825 [bioreactor metagenome]|uniref:Uncharacterized protein n=1 Tax=bioreactor metagenome TaxID=1076179 RepID=A0A645ASH2_9ZZZZ
MECQAPVGVHHDLATCQAGVGTGPALNETAGGIDEDAGVCIDGEVDEGRLEHLFDELALEGVQILVTLMLDRDDDGGNPDGNAIIVLHRNLGLAVAADPHDGAVLAALVQDAADAVGEFKRQRDVCGCLVGCIPVHRALVPGSQFIHLTFGIPDL